MNTVLAVTLILAAAAFTALAFTKDSDTHAYDPILFTTDLQ